MRVFAQGTWSLVLLLALAGCGGSSEASNPFSSSMPSGSGTPPSGPGASTGDGASTSASSSGDMTGAQAGAVDTAGGSTTSSGVGSSSMEPGTDEGEDTAAGDGTTADAATDGASTDSTETDPAQTDPTDEDSTASQDPTTDAVGTADPENAPTCPAELPAAGSSCEASTTDACDYGETSCRCARQAGWVCTDAAIVDRFPGIDPDGSVTNPEGCPGDPPSGGCGETTLICSYDASICLCNGGEWGCFGAGASAP